MAAVVWVEEDEGFYGSRCRNDFQFQLGFELGLGLGGWG